MKRPAERAVLTTGLVYAALGRLGVGIAAFEGAYHRAKQEQASRKTRAEWERRHVWGVRRDP